MSFKCQIFRKRLTFFHNVLELSCDVRIIILCCFIIATILPSNIKCAKLSNPQIRLLINDEDLMHEKSLRHEAAAAAAASDSNANVHGDNSGEHFNLYRSELKRLSYETIHRILRDENEPSYRREETELRYYQKRSPPAYEDISHQLNKRSTANKDDLSQQNIALNYSKRQLHDFVITDQLAKELSSASSLDLSDNHLTTLNLTLTDHLHALNLSNNSFTTLAINEKSQLKTLNLNHNNISHSSLESNIYLHNLYLSDNRLGNILSLNLSLLKNLETLDISCNHLTNQETSFFPERMHNLKHLNMAHNQLGAIYRETFYNLLSLNTLLLSHNDITEIDYETFLALPNLQYLDLSYNQLKGKSIRALQGITGLVALNIAYNPELGPYMQEFVASWSLKELDASGTGLCQIPAALAQSVRSLKLTHNWLKVINCGDLDSYPLLQYLDLSHSHIEEIEDDALGRLEILEILMLDHNNLKKIPQSLPVSLEHLFLQNNNILDIQSQSFQGLTSLKTLDLSNNKLLYLPDIALPKLQTLNLQSSEIRGISQGIIHTLPRLNELLLEDNPIKCSDLLGIAEWASTCRLRGNKEEIDAEEDLEENVKGKRNNLKEKYMKMYDFYEKFGGEQCQRNVDLNSSLNQPICAKEEKPTTIAPNKQLPAVPKKVALERSLEVENFNLNSVMNAAIPLPSKKAMKLEASNKKPTTIATEEAAVKAITTNEMPAPIKLEMKTDEEEQGKSTKSPATLPPTTLQTTLASVDKPQEHSNSTNERQEFQSTPKALIDNPTTAAVPPATVKENAMKKDTRQTIAGQRNSNSKNISSTANTLGGEGNGATPSMAPQQQPNIVGVEQITEETLLPTANLPEILKENMEAKNDKEIAERNKDMAADNMTGETTTTTPVTLSNIAKITSAMAINLTKSQGNTIMSDKANEERMTAKTLPLPTEEASIKLSNGKLRHREQKEEIKMKIGLTKEIKSFEGLTTQAPATTTTKGLSPMKMTLTSSIAEPQTTYGYANINIDHSNEEEIVITGSQTAPTALETVRGNEESSHSRFLPMPQSRNLTSNNNNSSNTTTTTTHTNNINLPHDNENNNKMSSTLEITTTATPKVLKQTTNKHQDLLQQPQQQQHQYPLPTHTSHDSPTTITAEPENPSMTVTASTTKTKTMPLERNDVNDECLQSNANGCADRRPQRQDKLDVTIGKRPTAESSHEVDVVETTTAAATMSTTSTKTTTAPAAARALEVSTVATTNATTIVHKHEPLQLHIKDRHLIGTPLLMHKGDNLMVATDELIKASPQELAGKHSTTTTTTTTSTTTTAAALPTSTALASTATGPQTAQHEAKNSKTILAAGQSSTKPFRKNHDDGNVNDMLSRHHHEPFEHKGETIKVKDYSLYAKKSNNADMLKTKKPSLIMKKMTIVTKQHGGEVIPSPTIPTTSNTTPLPDAAEANLLNEKEFSERHFQELKPQEHHPSNAKHSTVNTPINNNNKPAHLVHEPQTFQHEHELLMQQILHDEQQQQQHAKLSQSEQWSDLRKANNKDNHPGLILLVSSGLFVVLLLGLMHVYRCDVPWRRSSPAHHLRPHQRHNASLDDDVHSFLSYNEGMQKWHHSTRLEAPYSSPLHNLHVRELQKTSATEKPATIKTTSSYSSATTMSANRNHILPRNNSQSSSATTRTTSPSSSAILDDETFYIEMTPPAGQLAQALHSELLPMELLNIAQSKTGDVKETAVGDLQTSLQDDYEFPSLTSSRTHTHGTPYRPTTTTATTSASSRRDLLTSSTATAAASTSAATSSGNSQKPLYNSRKFGLW
ncbi:uncharacterized protein [Musca autumnalis]|uniref:uncharacterized protein n=1 Tax=Musca autumnalis TaxID=221902 RepID=UPI003CFBC0BD